LIEQMLLVLQMIRRRISWVFSNFLS